MSKGIYTHKKLSIKHKNNIRQAMSRPEVKKKMKENHRDISGKNNPTYGRDQSGKNNGMYGKGYLITGENNGNWKKSEYSNKEGRYFVWIKNIKYYRARYIAEQCLNRKLKKKECVHHINEDKSDDRPENLYVFTTKGKHTRHHFIKKPSILISNLI